MVEALNEALREEMARDSRVIILGEDIGSRWQGAFKVTKGLADFFGTERVRDTPISENAIIGCGVGAAITGLRPVCEIMFGDLLTLAMDQIVNQAAKMRYMFGGKIKVPIVIRTPFGAGGSYAGHHSSSYESWFINVPGLRVVQPSTPYDAKGLLKTSIRSDDPVMFFENKFIYRISGSVPEEEYTIPFGQADIKRSGDDITVIATSLMVHRSLRAAEELEQQGISVEVIDPRTLAPLDTETIVTSARKTGRVVIVHEACDFGGISGEITKTIVNDAFWYLDAPIKTVAGKNCPVPFSPGLESYVIPSESDIVRGISEIAKI